MRIGTSPLAACSPRDELRCVLRLSPADSAQKDWSAQLNFRNLQNWNSDQVTVMRRQPDGSAARARFDPPLQILLTNTFRF